MGKSRNRVLFLIVLIVLSLLAVLMFHTRKDELRGSASRGGNFGFQSHLDVAALPSLPPQEPLMPQTAPTNTPPEEELQSTATEPSLAQPVASPGANLLSIRKVLAIGMASGANRNGRYE
jgi:hypothetical protein